MNIYLDLDGTLIDSKQRLYKLFQHLVVDSDLTFFAYWELKRNKVNHKTILTSKYNYTQDQYDDFHQKWMTEIELTKWLDLDTPFEGVVNFLAELARNHRLHIVTSRQNKKNTLLQIKHFSWKNYITSILITEQKYTKLDLIRNSILVDAEDWFIGDTGKDIETGKKLGVKTAAVLTGFLNKECLSQYHPDILIEDITKFNFKNGKF